MGQDSFNFDDFSRIQQITDSESDIHELRFFSETVGDIPLQWNLGAFVFEEEQKTFLGGVGDNNQFFLGNEFNQRTDTDSHSFYTDATYSITNEFRFTGGLRYTKDEKKRTGVNARYTGIFAGMPNFAAVRIGPRIGSDGFQFNALGRKIINPDTGPEGRFNPVNSGVPQPISDQEILDFYLDGIGSSGERDTFNEFFPGGVIPSTLPLCSTVETAANLPLETICPAGDRVTYLTLGADIALQNGRLDNDFIDWRIRPEFDITEDNLVYGLIATGNKSGGFNDNVPNISDANLVAFDGTTPAPTYDEESVMLFEVGSKNEFDLNLGELFGSDFKDIGDIGVTFNASGFYYDYADLQVTNLISNEQVLDMSDIGTPQQRSNAGSQVVSLTFNASDAEIYGAQFEGGFQFFSGWNLDYTFLWLETEIKKSIPVQDSRFERDLSAANAVDRSIEGHRLPRTPEYQLNVSISRAFDVSHGFFDGVLSAGYRSSQHMTIFNGRVYDYDSLGTTDAQRELQRLRIDDEVSGYWTFDAGVGYSYGSDDAIRVEAYVNNITNVEQPQAIIITQRDNTRFFSRQRTAGLRVRLRF